MAAMLRPIALMCAFVVGWFFPQGGALAWTIPWFVRFMLFMVFLGLNVHKMALRRSHVIILALNLFVGVAFCELFRVFGDAQGTLASAAFCTLLCRVFTSPFALGAAIPPLTAVMAVVCPIFLSVRLPFRTDYLFPVTYAVKGIRVDAYLWYGLIFAAICLALAFLLDRAKRSRRILFAS